MSAVELTPEMRLIEAMQSQIDILRSVLNAVLIKNAGITELEGDYIEVYEQAERYVQRRTSWAIDEKIKEKELARLENQIAELKQKADELRQDSGLPYPQKRMQVGTGIGLTTNVTTGAYYYKPETV